MTVQAVLLPGYPYRVLVLDYGLVIPAKIVNRASRGAKALAMLGTQTAVRRTWVVEGYVVTEIKERRVVLPPLLPFRRGVEKEMEIAYRWFAIDVGYGIRSVTARRARHLILDALGKDMMKLDRYRYVDEVVRGFEWIRELFYVSAHEVERLDVERIRSSSGVVDGRCAKYVLLNKYRALLVT